MPFWNGRKNSTRRCMTLFTATKNRQADKDGKQPPVSKKKRLSRADRRQIEAAIARANRTDRKEKSAQDSIPYGA